MGITESRESYSATKRRDRI